MPIPTVDSTKKTASEKLSRGDPDLLTLQPLGLEKVANSNLSSSSHTSGSSVTDSSHESATSLPLLELVHLHVAGIIQRECICFPSSMIPLVVFSLPKPRMS